MRNCEQCYDVAQRLTPVRRLALTLVGILGMSPIVAGAAVFPDVSDSHLYRTQIEALVAAQVITGNPDGTFAPERTVNRAEMLAMLYRALGKTPDPAHVDCFPDVPHGSWYEAIVCDADANRFVGGYPDGTFKPGSPVNRVEALKMILEMFDITAGRYGVEERDIIKFVDVSTSAWYSGYLYTAFSKGVLPIPGHDGARFYPEWPLKRGEAAAYIYNALQVGLEEARNEEEVEPAEEEPIGNEGGNASSGNSGTPDEDKPVSMAVDFPFSTSGKFSGKQTFSYTFTLSSDVTALAAAKLTANGKITCRLYKIADDGFSTEYHLGYQQDDTCTLLATLSAGDYQLQLQPTVADATFTVDMKATTGDGNDGFKDAKRLLPAIAKTVTMAGENFTDFYTFSVPTEKSMKVELSNSSKLTCIIYPMEDVDLASFTGPECNQNYVYTPGTYYVAVNRGTTKGSKQTYTILLR